MGLNVDPLERWPVGSPYDVTPSGQVCEACSSGQVWQCTELH